MSKLLLPWNSGCLYVSNNNSCFHPSLAPETPFAGIQLLKKLQMVKPRYVKVRPYATQLFIFGFIAVMSLFLFESCRSVLMM